MSVLPNISHLSFYRTQAKNTDPDQTLHNASSDQGVHRLLAECSILLKFEYN